MNTDPLTSIPKHLLREDTTSTQAKNKLGKEDFLTLLMAQIKNQDPLNPTNHQEMATQLAQFSQLEQLSNIGKGIESMQTSRGQDTRLQAVGMIGKEVRAAGGVVDLPPGGNVSLKYLADSEATPARAIVFDPKGTLIREIDLLSQKNVNGLVTWDGKDREGNQAAAGSYSYKIYGVGKDGQGREMPAEVSGKVIKVELDGDTPILIVDTGAGTSRMELSKVGSISLPEVKPAKAEGSLKIEAPVVAIAPKENPEATETETTEESHADTFGISAERFIT